ncbi:glycosyl transferase family 2 [Psychromonas sp. psych-6C06]|uniref:glycosyltransferase n=1 Tax=Psychromonas sp. psych-6C06 TaxID=2058089 RepID=UPI000C3461A4|nr:glycosyltransferase [Psychromonas sp. psych-6C06]PKF61725.1 glycosyl transferase family 2 [Psychromonas sp. psych-6C06]
MKPLVSVYITTHNRAERLILAINSVLMQTYQNIEIIVSDDGSKDNTKAVVSNLMKQYHNIRYTRNDESRGANHARNKALAMAKGEFITGLDDDDLFTPTRVAFFVLNWDDEYSFICDNFVNSKKLEMKPHYEKTTNHIITLSEMLFCNMASNQIFTKTSRLKKINGFNENLRRLQDWDCWLRMVVEYGNAMRFNEKSYIMHHDELIRVSKSISSLEAYKALVKVNPELFPPMKDDFINKYILKTVPIKYCDCFIYSSLWELQRIIVVIQQKIQKKLARKFDSDSI